MKCRYLLVNLVLVTTSVSSASFREVITKDRAVLPYPINDTTVFPGTGGCRPHFNYYEGHCGNGGDYGTQCIPTADGGHRCVCSDKFQLYSDGICKPKRPCDNNAGDGMSYQDCEFSGGVCKPDPSTPAGYTCDCTGTGKFTSLKNMKYQCVADPCTASNLYIYASCIKDGGICTPKNADPTSPTPYSCQCPGTTHFMSVNPAYNGPDCLDVCTNRTNNPDCEMCTYDTTKPFGYNCGCNSPNYVYYYWLGCYDPCTGAPNKPSQEGLFPRLAGINIGYGNDACRLTDAAATCYTTENSPLYYQCNCSPGYANTFLYNGTGVIGYWGEPYENIITCRDIDECATPNPCGSQDANAVCTNIPGSYSCQCSPGFTLSANICIPSAPNPCAAPSPCGPDDAAALCTNVGGSAVCQCSSGFMISAGICIKDQCAVPNICGTTDTKAVCTSTAGSHTCQCSAGFELISGICDFNECSQPNACGTDDKNALCTNIAGSYSCQCSTGFMLNGNKCIMAPPTDTGACFKADPLDGNPCNNEADRNATCIATCSTTYTCKCSKGFWNRDGTCADANECEFQTNPCPNVGCGKNANTICRNFVGSHSCSCGNGAKCPCGTPAVCDKKSDRLMKCRCGQDVYYYY